MPSGAPHAVTWAVAADSLENGRRASGKRCLSCRPIWGSRPLLGVGHMLGAEGASGFTSAPRAAPCSPTPPPGVGTFSALILTSLPVLKTQFPKTLLPGSRPRAPPPPPSSPVSSASLLSAAASSSSLGLRTPESLARGHRVRSDGASI